MRSKNRDGLCDWGHTKPDGQGGTVGGPPLDFPEIWSPTDLDRTAWHKKNNPFKNCAWVSAKPDTRCNAKGFDNTRAQYSCPSTCNPAVNIDNVDPLSPRRYKKGDPSKNCAWVSINPEKRCDTKGWDNSRASEYCNFACAE